MIKHLTSMGVAVALLGCSTDEDPYLWLEDVEGDAALAWVEGHNETTRNAYAEDPDFKSLEQRLLGIFDADDRIPYIYKAGDWYYNLWQDEDNPRGLWRRTTLEEYRKPDPAWEVVLDIDALGEEEGENWVYGGTSILVPTYDRCLLRLSRGGADAVVVREFDLVAKMFVDDGFSLPESKQSVAWAGPDEIFVATDFGPGTMTDSGYARFVKLWQRGQALEDAITVFEGETSDVSVGAYAELSPGFEMQFVYRGRDFYNSDRYIRRGDELVPLAIPSDAGYAVHRGWLYVTPRSDWQPAGRTYETGSLLAIKLDRFLAGERDLDVLFEPGEGTALAGYSLTRHHVLVNILDNVRNRIEVATPGPEGWTAAPLAGIDATGFQTIDADAVDPDGDDRYFLETTDYLTPSTVSLAAVGEDPVVVKSAPSKFNADGLVIAQHWAPSPDGTRIPYFQVSRADTTEPQPTLLYGYGGFRIAQVPRYSAGIGAAWLERGGVYVVANIRGGGEFGPEWHQAALKANRPRAYEDFIAVGEDLIRRGVTTSTRLGVMGGSNGGLLMGNMLTMRPDVFGAIVAQVPLFDMRRYHELLAGASWIAEYGNPDDPEEWAFIEGFSPYHNVSEDVDYPKLLVTTSTRDDRVHPGHARKMVAKMRDMGHDVLYYENVEGGHAGAADNAQRAYMWTLAFRFLWDALASD
ncbi:MAG: prolyl oligopeptidase family serine peptidase [Gammaproteobacteria bacterium]|nr:prolyl oligopeptidase family serine peptidase [Gammaproteobacteria bacterium]